jgi:hypothetical protein
MKTFAMESWKREVIDKAEKVVGLLELLETHPVPYPIALALGELKQAVNRKPVE